MYRESFVQVREYVENYQDQADVKIKIFNQLEAKRAMVVGSTSSSRSSGFPKIKNAPGEPDALYSVLH